MSLTHEDVLRELELLPVWRLNTSLDSSIDEPMQAKQELASGDVQIETVIEGKVGTRAEEIAAQQITLQEFEASAPAPALPNVANMDWAELKQHVVGSGDPNADWVFVGDVPSDGDAGILLDKMLIAIQLQRGKNVYLTEVTELDFFNRQIALIQPKLIFAFGEKSAQILLDSKEPLDALRGQVHQYHGVALVVSYPPSHLLHQTQDKAKSWADLCLARNTIEQFN